MNHKFRLRNIELSLNDKYTFDDLLKPDFTFTGKPFNSFPDIFKYFKIGNVPDSLTNEQMQIFYDKGLISVSINEVIAEMKRCL